MKKISFAHNFIKLDEQKTAELVRVKIISRTELDEETVIANTQYYENHEVPNSDTPIRGIKCSHIPNGSLLLLVFLGDRNIPFTTLRQFKDATWKRYKSMLNHIFEIVVEEQHAKKKV